MRQRDINVDVQTFGSLALSCERQNDGLQLLRDMEVRIHNLEVTRFNVWIIGICPPLVWMGASRV